MEKKLTWGEIQRDYDQQWVLLDDYDWPEEEEFPTSGIVKIHAKERTEFDRLIAARSAGFDSALVFVGGPERAERAATTRGYSRVEFGAK